MWYALARDGAGVVIGTYDYKADRWSPKATIQPREGEWGHHDFAVLPDGRKAYVAVLGPWLPDYHAAGWVLPTGMAVS